MNLTSPLSRCTYFVFECDSEPVYGVMEHYLFTSTLIPSLKLLEIRSKPKSLLWPVIIWDNLVNFKYCINQIKEIKQIPSCVMVCCSVCVCSVPVLCCSTSQPCWSAVFQLWSPCWSQSQWESSVSIPVGSRCCQTGTPCCTTPVQTTSTHYTAPRRPSTHCKYWLQGGGEFIQQWKKGKKKKKKEIRNVRPAFCIF